jgi:hypothetical protein
MKTFTIEVRYSFTGTYQIEAENRKEAIRIAEQDCGCVAPIFQTSNDQAVKNWEFPLHPEVKAVSISA